MCPGTYGQGFLSLWPGREVVDYAVPAVLDQDPVDDGVRGDAYYVVVQAANATSRFRLSGYLPRTSAGSTDTTSDATFTRFSFKTPASARASIAVTGAPYGGPFDLTPTSQGEVECRLQYPANAGKRTVEPASPSQKASFEQYVYPPLWEPEGDAIPVSQPTDPSHWDLYDLNRHAAAPLTGDDWYGLQGGFAVQAAGPWAPRQTYHYVPVLWLAAAQPYASAPALPGPPATGLRTVGYKATLLIPQNLRLASATPKVRRGRAVTLKGSLAVPSDATPGATVAWAPAGTLVTAAEEDRLALDHDQGREDRRERFVARRPSACAGPPSGAPGGPASTASPPSTPWSSAPPSARTDVLRPQGGRSVPECGCSWFAAHFVIQLREFARRWREPGATRRRGYP